MTKNELARRMQQAQAWVPGKRIRIDFGGKGAILLDGVAREVSEEDGEADTVIGIEWDDWQQIAAGQLDPMSAFMSGRLRVEGDMTSAMQLGGVLSKLRAEQS